VNVNQGVMQIAAAAGSNIGHHVPLLAVQLLAWLGEAVHCSANRPTAGEDVPSSLMPLPVPGPDVAVLAGGHDRRDGRFVGGQVASYPIRITCKIKLSHPGCKGMGDIITEYYVNQTCHFALVGRDLKAQFGTFLYTN